MFICIIQTNMLALKKHFYSMKEGLIFFPSSCRQKYSVSVPYVPLLDSITDFYFDRLAYASLTVVAVKRGSPPGLVELESSSDFWRGHAIHHIGPCHCIILCKTPVNAVSMHCLFQPRFNQTRHATLAIPRLSGNADGNRSCDLRKPF